MESEVLLTDRESLKLPDGRTLGYAQSGAREGRPVIFVPGYGHSRLARGDAAASAALGARVVTIDVPGVGLSDPHRGYTLSDWTGDLRSLVDVLAFDRFAVAGWSWGAPYALAAACRLTDRVSAVGVISGLTGWLAGPDAVTAVRPEFRTFASWCRRIRPAARAFVAFQARGFRRDPEGTVRKEAATTGGDDQSVIADDGVRGMLVASAHEVWDRGGEGTYEHSIAVTQPWGFSLADITQHVEIWHGTGDNEILPTMAEQAARNLRDARVHIIDGRGHLLVFADWGTVIASLLP